MYQTEIDGKEMLIEKAIELLSNEDLFFNSSLEMISKWVVSSSENLSNQSSNRRSWIGQATCCYVHGVPEILTRVAWSRMTDRKRKEANLKANKIIRIYEEENRRIHTKVGTSMLF